MSDNVLSVEELAKSFVSHRQGGEVRHVLRHVSFSVSSGSCLNVEGPSGVGKSTLLRMLYGNYRVEEGRVEVYHRGGWTNLASADPREILQVRQMTVGFVSQFLHVIPRVPTLDVVAGPLLRLDLSAAEAKDRAVEMLEQLSIGERLWNQSPLVLSGGEQQRVNLARALAPRYPILILDEPTASLDGENRLNVVRLLQVERDRGVAIIGTLADVDSVKRLATNTMSLKVLL